MWVQKPSTEGICAISRDDCFLFFLHSSCQIWSVNSYVWRSSWAQMILGSLVCHCTPSSWSAAPPPPTTTTIPNRNEQGFLNWTVKEWSKPDTLIVLQQRSQRHIKVWRVVWKWIFWRNDLYLVYVCLVTQWESKVSQRFLARKDKNYNKNNRRLSPPPENIPWKRHAQFRPQGHWKKNKNYDKENMTKQKVNRLIEIHECNPEIDMLDK